MHAPQIAPRSSSRVRGREMSRTRSPAAQVRRLTHPPGNLLQRKPACACGDTCPRCAGEAPLHAKLAVSRPDDEFEREADRVADAVLRMPAAEAAVMSRGNAGVADPTRIQRAPRPGRPAAAGGTRAGSLGPRRPPPARARGLFVARLGE